MRRACLSVLGASVMDTPLTLSDNPPALAEAVLRRTASARNQGRTSVPRRLQEAVRQRTGRQFPRSRVRKRSGCSRLPCTKRVRPSRARPSRRSPGALPLKGWRSRNAATGPARPQPVGPAAIEKDYSGHFEQVLAANQNEGRAAAGQEVEPPKRFSRPIRSPGLLESQTRNMPVQLRSNEDAATIIGR
jgi:hypothetical protein